MSETEKKQTTEKGQEIPIPTRKAFMDDLKKVAKPADEQSRPRRPKK